MLLRYTALQIQFFASSNLHQINQAGQLHTGSETRKRFTQDARHVDDIITLSGISIKRMNKKKDDTDNIYVYTDSNNYNTDYRRIPKKKVREKFLLSLLKLPRTSKKSILQKEII